MGKGKGHIPIRTCIVCGTKQEKKRLIRLFRDAGGHLVKDDGKRQGRGAYVCRRESCLTKLSPNDGLRDAQVIGPEREEI